RRTLTTNEKAALVASMGAAFKVWQGRWARDGKHCPCLGMIWGCWDWTPLSLRQTVPRDDVSSAASGWAKCEKKWSPLRWSLTQFVKVAPPKFLRQLR